MQNVDCFEFFRSSLFRSKNHSFLSRITKNVSLWLFFVKKKGITKRLIFWQNHGLTPLQNVDFFRLFENFTFKVQKALFSVQNIKKCFFLAFLAKKRHIRKRSIFWQKPWTNPFPKCRFFSDFVRTSLLRSKSFIFYLEYQKKFLFGFIFC